MMGINRPGLPVKIFAAFEQMLCSAGDVLLYGFHSGEGV